MTLSRERVLYASVEGVIGARTRPPRETGLSA
jgi:hypothetical protein